MVVVRRRQKEARINRDQFWLRDEQASKIGPLLAADTHGGAGVDDHLIINGVAQILRSGWRWIDAPRNMIHGKSSNTRYAPRAANGVPVRLFRTAQAGNSPDRFFPALRQ